MSHREYQTFDSSTSDIPLVLTFVKTTVAAPLSKAISVYAFDNNLLLELSIDGTNFDNPIEISSQVTYYLNASARAARVRNKTVGLNTRFQLTAWYIISPYRAQ